MSHLLWITFWALESAICVKCSRAIARRKHRSQDTWTYLAFLFGPLSLLVLACLGRRSDEHALSQVH
jgi:hypothetical protein